MRLKQTEEKPVVLFFLMYLKDLHLLQSDLLTLTMIFGQMNGLQNQTRVWGTQHINVRTRLNQENAWTQEGRAYLCRWTGRRRCCPLPPLCPPPIYWICSERPLWPGGGALPEAAHFPITQSNNAFKCNTIALLLLYKNKTGHNLIRINQYNLFSTITELNL